MGYLAKLMQATALGLVAVGFLAALPNLRDPRTLVAGIALFTVGWFIERKTK